MMEVDKVAASPSNSPPHTTSSKASMRVSYSRLDIDSYLAEYTGPTKLLRLKHIAATFSNLRGGALELLAAELKQGLNVDMLGELSQVASMVNCPDDDEWTRKAHQERRRGMAAAEANLSHAKSSSIKESIRRAHVEMGNLLVEHGELIEAVKCYQRTRDYFGKPEHSVETYTKIAICHIDLGRSNSAMAEHALMKIDVPLTPTLKGQVMAIQALLSMLAGRYARAAREFLDIDCAALNKDSLSSVVSIADIGLYSCLCALATLDLGEIKRLALDSRNCKLLLEQAPEMRSMVEAFCSSSYGEFLRLLAVKQPDMQLDTHLHGHLEGLLHMIANRVLIQYCKPYITLDLRRMAAALNKEVHALESNLAKLIAKGDIPFRIDSAQHQLHRKVQNEHDVAYEKVTALAEMHASSVRQGILRLSLQQHNFSVMPEQSASKSSTGKDKRARRSAGAAFTTPDEEGAGAGAGAEDDDDLDDTGADADANACSGSGSGSGMPVDHDMQGGDDMACPSSSSSSSSSCPNAVDVFNVGHVRADEDAAAQCRVDSQEW